MDIKVLEKRVLSSDGVHTLVGKVYLPDCEPKGYLHVVHGMEEHIGRYDRFMRRAAEDGYIVFGYDNLGHGLTAEPTGDFGYIAESDGWKRLAQDVEFFSSAVMSEYGTSLDYYLMGHSMGSFIVRAASELYVKPKKLVVMGTGGPVRFSDLGLLTVKLNKLIYGDRHLSKAVFGAIFGSYNSRFRDEHDTRSWLSTDKAERDKNRDDRFCRIKFTIGAMEDLLRLQKFVNRREWFSALPQSLPILLVSGDNDPVGNYGKGVKKVFELLRRNGKNVRLKLYEGYRHEILNDFCRDEVTKDILDFLKR